MLQNSENNARDEIGLVTPTPGQNIMYGLIPDTSQFTKLWQNNVLSDTRRWNPRGISLSVKLVTLI